MSETDAQGSRPGGLAQGVADRLSRPRGDRAALALLRPIDFASRALWLAVVLLAFSTGVGGPLGVISPAIPVFALVALTTALLWGLGGLRLPAPSTLPTLGGSLLLASILLSWPMAPHVMVAGKRVLDNALGFAAFVFMVSWISLPSQELHSLFRGTVHAVVLCGVAISLYCLANFASAIARHGSTALLERFSGGALGLPWGVSNVVAGVLILPLFTAILGLRLWPHGAWARVCLFAVVAMSLAVLSTMSRGAISAVAGGLLVLAMLGGHRRVLGFFALATGAMLLVLKWLSSDYVVGQILMDRLSLASDLNGRLPIWQQSISLLMARPFHAIGYYGSLEVFGYSSHSYILTTLLERGLVGTGLALVLPTLAVSRVIGGLSSRKGRSRFFCVWAVALGVAAFAHLLVEDVNFNDQYILLGWVVWGLVFVGTSAIQAGGADS